MFATIPGLLSNLGIIAIFMGAWTLTFHWWSRHLSVPWRSAAMSAMGGLCAVLMITVPIEFKTGLLQDLRAVPIAFAGFFGGPLVGVTVGSIAATFRLYIGGVGAQPALISITAVTFLGIATGWLCSQRRMTIRCMVFLSLVVAPASVIGTFFIPAEIRGDAIRVLIFPGIIACFIGMLLVGAAIAAVYERVSSEAALRASEERYRLASRATNDVIWDWSLKDHRATWAGAYKKVLGYPELERGTSLEWWLDHIHPDDRPRVLGSQSGALDGGADYWEEEYRFHIISGEWVDVRTRCVIVRNAAGTPSRLVGSMLDVTQQKRAELALSWAAHHDPLTSLPNRALYAKRIRDALDMARQHDQKVALVVLDLNNFKALNDTLGHAVGDAVLEQTATRLIRGLPETATVARLGGDEFAIILPALASAEAYKPHTENITKALSEHFLCGDLRFPVNFSAGVVVYPRDGADATELLIAADLALFAAKAEMPGTIVAFSPLLKGAAERNSRMIQLARQALAQDRIFPYYQPKVDLRTGRVVGWEALLRIRSEDDKILPPSEIAAAFADAEISVQLTDRMLDRILSDLADWRARGFDPGRMAVNVSAADFLQHGLVDRLRSRANAFDQSLSAFDVEVTETVLIGQLGAGVSRVLMELRAMGVRIALDDFGTGFASLTHLQQFPVDVLKIDKSFTERINTSDPRTTAVIDSVLQMAKQLGLQTVAEGIETVEQARYLRARGCTTGQGYLFERPLPAGAVPLRHSSHGSNDWVD